MLYLKALWKYITFTNRQLDKMNFIHNDSFCCYEIEKKENLLLESFAGKITLSAMREYISDLIKNQDYHRDMDLLTDISLATYDGLTKEVVDYIQHLHDNDQSIGVRKTAVVYQTPNQHIYAMIFVNVLYKEYPDLIKLFTDRESAIKWLRPNQDNSGLQQKLDKMEEKSIHFKLENKSI